jgi:uncharacterized membrane protein YgcG
MISKDPDQSTKIQMAFVTVVSLEGLSGKEFATQLGNRWGVGHKDTIVEFRFYCPRMTSNNRISIGLGLESVLRDDEVDKLGKEMSPLLRNAEYGPARLHLANAFARKSCRS